MRDAFVKQVVGLIKLGVAVARLIGFKSRSKVLSSLIKRD